MCVLLQTIVSMLSKDQELDEKLIFGEFSNRSPIKGKVGLSRVKLCKTILNCYKFEMTQGFLKG